MSSSSVASDVSGGCACGRIRYTAQIDSDDAYLCHCRMCQRASGNVSLAMKTVPQAAVNWEQEPSYFQSSPIAKRGFCSACGTSITFQYLADTDKMDLIVGTFDDPSRFRPTSHFGAESMHRAWLDTSGLPETRSDAYERLNQRWMDALGKLPD